MTTNVLHKPTGYERAYARALTLLVEVAASAVPDDDAARMRIKGAREKAEFAFSGIAPSKRTAPAKFKSDVDKVLAETTWTEARRPDPVANREFQVPVFPRVREHERRHAIRFVLLRPETRRDWDDFSAWVHEVDGEWRIVRDGENYLNRHKDELCLNDAEIDAIHHAAERMPFDGPDAP